jgi:hypothetical protein
VVSKLADPQGQIGASDARERLARKDQLLSVDFEDRIDVLDLAETAAANQRHYDTCVQIPEEIGLDNQDQTSTIAQTPDFRTALF